MDARKQGAKALAAGLLCWGVDAVLALTTGMYGVILVILGALGVWAGIVLVLFGGSFRMMPASQKIPAGLLALVLAAVPAFLLLRLVR